MAGDLYYPNRLVRAFLLAMQEVVGRYGTNQVLTLAGMDALAENTPEPDLEKSIPIASMTAISMALEQMYGQRGGRGIALRIGRASFHPGFEGLGILKGIQDPAFGRLPQADRVHIGLAGLASAMTTFTDMTCSLEDTTDLFKFVVEHSAFTWERTSDQPVCHALVGMIQESIHWMSGGYEYGVQETTCRAMGADVCIFLIQKRPVGQLKRNR